LLLVLTGFAWIGVPREAIDAVASTGHRNPDSREIVKQKPTAVFQQSPDSTDDLQEICESTQRHWCALSCHPCATAAIAKCSGELCGRRAIRLLGIFPASGIPSIPMNR
jgi:hypothetical protein